MLTNTMPVALLTSNQQEAQLFTSALGECGFRRFTTFTSGEEAYEVCSRQQFPLFITRMELADMSGIVFLQKLRETGNYGMEPHLFVCNKLDPKLVNILADLDLDYVLVPPLQKANIVQKFKHMIQTENNLSSVEVQYRDAKAAFSNNIFDMAESFIKAALAEKPDLEKAVILLGDIEAKRNNIALANQQYKTALSINPKSATAMHKLAQILMAQGEYGQATAFFATSLSRL
ncbi:MAG: tetratricopeptide repeat protein [Proteobacteria bacterium]|nr:tetratricopeptide repeat protein [Pseudomonadota bacterium]